MSALQTTVQNSLPEGTAKLKSANFEIALRICSFISTLGLNPKNVVPVVHYLRRKTINSPGKLKIGKFVMVLHDIYEKK